MRRFLHEHLAEVAIAVVVGVSLWLFVDFSTLGATVERLSVLITGYSSPAALIGLVLIVLTGALLAWWLRIRFVRSSFWRVSACPKCGGPLHRVHRSRLDKVVGAIFLLPARRYQCADRQCGWTGLRHSRRHTEQFIAGERARSG
jgi:hypothetical protein